MPTSKPTATRHDGAFEAELIAVLPRLRAIAIMLTRDRVAADDLLQDAMVLALKGKDSYQLNTSMGAWMYRLMRNRMISMARRHKLKTVSIDDPAALGLSTQEEQPGHMLSLYVRRELEKLPLAQREALILVGAAGESYEAAAVALGCTLGTVKSRVSRAREALRKAVEGEPVPAPRSGAEHDDYGYSVQDSKPQPTQAHSRRSGVARDGHDLPWRT